jgi:hypothetical protein
LIKNKKSLTDGSITLMKMRPKVSINTINQYYQYQSIDPSLIVPSYPGGHVWLDGSCLVKMPGESNWRVFWVRVQPVGEYAERE